MRSPSPIDRKLNQMQAAAAAPKAAKKAVPARKMAELWDAATGKCSLTLSGHSDYVCSVAISGDGSVVVTGSNDKTAMLWDAATGKYLLTLSGHSDSVFCVAISGDGSIVVTGSGDKTAKLCDVTTVKCSLTVRSFRLRP